MKFPTLALAASLALTLSACGGGGAPEGNGVSANSNLDAENFSTTINSDDAVMNEADLRQLNRTGG
jgi:hypothetical protein